MKFLLLSLALIANFYLALSAKNFVKPLHYTPDLALAKEMKRDLNCESKAKYVTLAAAVTAAADGDDIVLCPGAHNISAPLEVTKRISISGYNALDAPKFPERFNAPVALKANLKNLPSMIFQPVTDSNTPYLTFSSGSDNSLVEDLIVRFPTIKANGSSHLDLLNLVFYTDDQLVASYNTSNNNTDYEFCSGSSQLRVQDCVFFTDDDSALAQITLDDCDFASFKDSFFMQPSFFFDDCDNLKVDGSYFAPRINVLFDVTGSADQFQFTGNQVDGVTGDMIQFTDATSDSVLLADNTVLISSCYLDFQGTTNVDNLELNRNFLSGAFCGSSDIVFGNITFDENQIDQIATAIYNISHSLKFLSNQVTCNPAADCLCIAGAGSVDIKYNTMSGGKRLVHLMDRFENLLVSKNSFKAGYHGVVSEYDSANPGSAAGAVYIGNNEFLILTGDVVLFADGWSGDVEIDNNVVMVAKRFVVAGAHDSGTFSIHDNSIGTTRGKTVHLTNNVTTAFSILDNKFSNSGEGCTICDMGDGATIKYNVGTRRGCSCACTTYCSNEQKRAALRKGHNSFMSKVVNKQVEAQELGKVRKKSTVYVNPTWPSYAPCPEECLVKKSNPDSIEEALLMMKPEGTIVLCPGTHLVDDTVTFSSKVQIKGADQFIAPSLDTGVYSKRFPENTKKAQKATKLSYTPEKYFGVAYVQFSNDDFQNKPLFLFNGNSDHSEIEDVILRDSAIEIDGVRDIEIDRVLFFDQSTNTSNTVVSVACSNSKELDIDDSLFASYWAQSMVIDVSGTSGVNIEDSAFHAVHISLDSSSKVRVHNNYFAYQSRGGSLNETYVQVSNNVRYFKMDDNMFVQAARVLSQSDNTQFKKVTVEDNKIYSPFPSSSSGSTEWVFDLTQVYHLKFEDNGVYSSNPQLRVTDLMGDADFEDNYMWSTSGGQMYLTLSSGFGNLDVEENKFFGASQRSVIQLGGGSSSTTIDIEKNVFGASDTSDAIELLDTLYGTVDIEHNKFNYAHTAISTASQNIVLDIEDNEFTYVFEAVSSTVSNMSALQLDIEDNKVWFAAGHAFQIDQPANLKLEDNEVVVANMYGFLLNASTTNVVFNENSVGFPRMGCSWSNTGTFKIDHRCNHGQITTCA